MKQLLSINQKFLYSPFNLFKCTIISGVKMDDQLGLSGYNSRFVLYWNGVVRIGGKQESLYTSVKKYLKYDKSLRNEPAPLYNFL